MVLTGHTCIFIRHQMIYWIISYLKNYIQSMGHMNIHKKHCYYSKHSLQMSVKFEEATWVFVLFSYNQQRQKNIFWLCNKSDYIFVCHIWYLRYSWIDKTCIHCTRYWHFENYTNRNIRMRQEVGWWLFVCFMLRLYFKHSYPLFDEA